MNEVKKLMGLDDKKIMITSIENEKIKGNNAKIINAISTIQRIKCPVCNKYTSSVHDYLKPINSKYVKVAEYDCYLRITRKRFICRSCNKRIIEDVGIVRKGKSITNILEIKIRKDLLRPCYSIKDIAEINNISSDKVRNILIEAMSDYPKYVKTLPDIISLDEFKADTNEGKYAFIMNDPIRKRTLDILPSRKKGDLISYFDRVENRENVRYVISDMYETYLIITKIMFKNAKYVVDRFHYTEYIMNALDNIRIRLQKTYGYNSREYKLLKNKKNISLLRKHYNDINWYVYTKRYEHGRYVDKLPINILNEMLSINEELDRGYQLKELFLDIVEYDLTPEEAKIELESWIDLCIESEIEEFIEASKTINNWLEYICNSYIDRRFTNGYTEGLNNKIKVIKRNAYGYKNFDFFRLRLMYIFNGKISGKINKNEKRRINKN